ncbi:MAG: ABC transporter ATP-binding protein [Campylobacterota bacterium]|nr:ABC transporter ATP-binding protein [Campylobacterota bacterium]MEA3554700.1 ABC transporter ATP-binding protein [Campylobacterota bacterium]
MILAKNITLSYDNKRNIIENGNFHIKEKDFIFITGSSGSGKSTLLKSLYGALQIKKGELFVNKVDLSKKNNKKLLGLRKNLGIVFQDYKLIQEYTIEQNIMLPLELHNYDAKVSANQVKNLLKHVQLSHRVGAYPAELSGGEQQRVAMARALAHNPSLILADEPTGNLDEYSANVIWKLLKDANQHLGITVVVVTHTIPNDFGINYRRFNIDDGVVYEAS